MSDNHIGFVGSVPDAYDRYLRPLLFESFARDLAARVAAGSGTRVLELACGTGILTRALAQHVGASAKITSTDLNVPMLELAKARVDAANVEWRQADAMSLPFADGVFDTVVCQFGVMFFPDKVKAAREVRRALRPGGVYLFNVWTALQDNGAARAAHETLARFFPSDPPNFYLVPFSYFDRAVIERDLREAGFSEITFERVEVEGLSPSAEDAATGLMHGNPVGMAVQERATASLDEVTRALAAELRKIYGAGEIRVPLRALVTRRMTGGPAHKERSSVRQ